MQHPKMNEWDDTLKAIFDEIDQHLEDKYGLLYSLHPNRQKRGTTSNPEMDGLFNVGASFSTGYGTELGKGYVVDIRLSTLEVTSPEILDIIESEVMELLRIKLHISFPGRKLFVERDGRVIKIHGDLSLGNL